LWVLFCLQDKLGETKLSYYKRNEVKFVKSTEQSGSSTSIAEVPSGSLKSDPSPKSLDVSQTPPADSPFVTCSDSGDVVYNTATSDLQNRISPHQDPSTSSSKTKAQFREEMQQYKTNVQQHQETEQLEKFYTLSNHIRAIYSKSKNAVEVLHMAADKSRMFVSPTITMDISGNYVCQLEVDCINVSLGRAQNKKGAKQEAFQRAIELLWKRHLKMNDDNPQKILLESSDRPFCTSVDKALDHCVLQSECQAKDTELESSNVCHRDQIRKLEAAPPSVDLSDFLVVEHQGSQNAVSVLHNSATINKRRLQVDFLDHGLKTRCQLCLDGHLIADELADGEAEAKAKAFEKGLQFLKTLCWTIETKPDGENADEAKVTREQLLGSIRYDVENAHVSNSNIGKKLMEKMGWKGGGLGKEGNEGIAEPIVAGNVISRAGLGLQAEQGISHQFLPSVKQMIQDYCLSDGEKDLVFSPLFSKEERAIIHKEAQKMNLKSHSHGQAGERYLVLSRKRTVAQLFSHIQKSGGETSKYVLVPPTVQNT